MAFLGILLICGFLTALILSGLIHINAKQRGLPRTLRLLWVSIVGSTSLGGFLVPYLYSSELGFLYFEVVQGRTVTVHPVEFLVVSLVTGVLISSGATFIYLAGSRVGQFRNLGKTEL